MSAARIPSGESGQPPKPIPPRCADLRQLPALSRFTADGHVRWVLWRYEWVEKPGKTGKWTKVPYQLNGHKAASNRPREWSRYGDVWEKFNGRVTNGFDGIGMVLLGLSDFAAIDLDKVRDRQTGALLPWAEEIANCGSYCEVTPSMAGLRVLGSWAGGKVHRNGPHPGGGSFELFADCERFITFTGLANGSAESWGDISPEASDLLALLDGRRGDAEANGAGIGSGESIDVQTLSRLAIEAIVYGTIDGQPVKKRGPQLAKVARELYDRGHTLDASLDLLTRHPNGIQAKYGSRLRKQLEGLWRKFESPETDEVIARFNTRYAVVNEAGKAFVYEQVDDQKFLVRITFSDLTKFYQNRLIKVGVDKSGDDKFVSEAKYWLNSPRRREYLGGVVFNPKGDARPDQWNLWSEFAVKPAPGDWSLMRDHIRGVICAGDDDSFQYTLNWTARMFQKPNRPGEVALVLRGLKGVGKGIFFHYLRKAWGQHGVYISNAKHLVGNFNVHLRDCVFLFADEAFFAGDRQHESVLKSLITDPVLPIEGKYQNVVNVANMLHVGMASNEDWVIPASHDERRYSMLDVSGKYRGDKKYFDAIGAQMDSGGLAAMIHELLDRNISGFDVGAIPNTDALVTQKKLSLDTLDRWLITVLERGFVWVSRHGIEEFSEWTPFCATELLDGSYQQWCRENRISRPTTREMLGKRLTEVFGLSSRPKGEWIIGETDSGTLLQRIDGVVVNSTDLIRRKHSARLPPRAHPHSPPEVCRGTWGHWRLASCRGTPASGPGSCRGQARLSYCIA
jgi:Family of unknown function (DUF5906)